jgi:hypothetical protein
MLKISLQIGKSFKLSLIAPLVQLALSAILVAEYLGSIF